MHFENEEAYERYPELQEEIKGIVFHDRGSQMRTESLRKIKQFRAKHATEDEITYFAGLMPQVVKGTRQVASSKRTVDGEIVSQAKTFDSDDLSMRQEANFIKNILPGKVEAVEKVLGLTNPKPDRVFGLQQPRFPNPLDPKLSSEAQALVSVAPGTLHAFFAIKNKGCEDSIEAAENQAIRSGATLVAARRNLNQMARNQEKDGNEQDGADNQSFAFSCSWVPQMANLHVHWYERMGDGVGVYHMNLLRAYLMVNQRDIQDLRHDIHNILDWGVSAKRKETLKAVVAGIVANEAVTSVTLPSTASASASPTKS